MKNLPAFLFFILVFVISNRVLAQSDSDLRQVTTILQQQSDHWNEGHLDSFMIGYWNSPYLQFIGSSGVTYGWEETLEAYKKRYPDRRAMGQLTFEILDITKRSKKCISLIGKFTLEREIGDLSGHFLLLWQKKQGEWVIVSDCTSSAP